MHNHCYQSENKEITLLRADPSIATSEEGEIKETSAPEERGGCFDVTIRHELPTVKMQRVHSSSFLWNGCRLLYRSEGISTLMFHCSVSTAVIAASLFGASQNSRHPLFFPSLALELMMISRWSGIIACLSYSHSLLERRRGMVEEEEVEEEGWCRMCEQLRLPNSRESCCVSSCLYFAFHPVVLKQHRHSLILKVVHTHTCLPEAMYSTYAEFGWSRFRGQLGQRGWSVREEGGEKVCVCGGGVGANRWRWFRRRATRSEEKMSEIASVFLKFKLGGKVSP